MTVSVKHGKNSVFHGILDGAVFSSGGVRRFGQIRMRVVRSLFMG
jgi:hypothetical protein